MTCSSFRLGAVGLAVAALLGAPAPNAHAQSGLWELNGRQASSGGDESTALSRGRYAVVVDLDENRLYFKLGEDVTLWSAPIGTGTGLRLETEDQKWDFSTPNGVFHVQYKEENPTWIAPDWYFIENGLPVPPPNDERRFFPGGLGAAAVYIGHDLAIHGTDNPELLGQRVSHGCIRLSNRDAIRLFHNVQVGTEVIIVGGEQVREEEAGGGARGNDPSTFNPASKKRPKDPVVEGWRKLTTDALLRELDDQLWTSPERTRWPEVASFLLKRGLEQSDDLALAGLLVMYQDLPSSLLEREYRTFLADAFARAPMRTLEVLSQLRPRDRDRAAEAIVAASLALYSGDLDAPSAPWPTRRIPRDLVRAELRRGWYAMARAERDLRRTSERTAA